MKRTKMTATRQHTNARKNTLSVELGDTGIDDGDMVLDRRINNKAVIGPIDKAKRPNQVAE
jgi:hypothetical protein